MEISRRGEVSMRREDNEVWFGDYFLVKMVQEFINWTVKDLVRPIRNERGMKRSNRPWA
jgi:hypothetical protein